MKIPELNNISRFAAPERKDGIFSAQKFKECVDDTALRFMYEPMTKDVMDQIAQYLQREISDRFEGSLVKEIKIDDMRNLDGRLAECEKCREAGSYEEYMIKRAAENLPDEAGSEKEWRRMAGYRPGAVTLDVVFMPAYGAQAVDYRAEIG